MAYDLEEQEKIASLKAWWDQYGNAVTSVILAVAVAYGGWQLWQWYQTKQVNAAAATYGELAKAVAAKDAARMREFAGLLTSKYGSTAYAEMGALLAAKASVDAGDAKAAKEQLSWVADKAADAEYRAIGRLRLAAVLMDEGQFDEAAKQVAASAATDLSVPLQAAFADRRGDIAAAQGKVDDAKREYEAAVGQLQGRADARGFVNVVQLKLDSLLGGVVAAADAKPAAPPATTPVPEKKTEKKK